MGIFIWMQVGNDRMFSLLSSLLFLFIAGCFVAPLWGTEDFGGAGFVEFNIFFSWMFAVSYTPLQQLVRKLGFVVLGVLTLVGLSEISKLNLHQYLQPPKVSENSAR